MVYDLLMKVVFQIVCTHVASVTVVDCEKGTFWPGNWVFIDWPSHVKDYAYSILIIVSLNSLVGVR